MIMARKLDQESRDAMRRTLYDHNLSVFQSIDFSEPPEPKQVRRRPRESKECERVERWITKWRDSHPGETLTVRKGSRDPTPKNELMIGRLASSKRANPEPLGDTPTSLLQQKRLAIARGWWRWTVATR